VVHKSLLQNKLHILLKGFLGFLSCGHFLLLKYVKLENSFEPRCYQYVIELYSKVVIKLYDIGVTNANQIILRNLIFKVCEIVREDQNLRIFFIPRNVTQEVMDRHKIYCWTVVSYYSTY
jgi:hypothetical protein